MKKLTQSLLFLASTLVLTPAKAQHNHHDHTHAHSEQTPVFRFETNKGQWPNVVKYKAQQANSTYFLEDNGFTYVFTNPEDTKAFSDWYHSDQTTRSEGMPINGHAYHVEFVGGYASQLEGENQLEGYANYFLGNNPALWASEVYGYKQVAYDQVYLGIHVLAHQEQGAFKYDFILEPGANHLDIQLEYTGTNGLELVNGDLIVSTAIGPIIEKAPIAWQTTANGEKQEVKCEYVLNGNTLGFSFPNGYNAFLPLIIDPVVIASTLSGTTGPGANYGHSATYDNAGNIYTGATAAGQGYPVTLGAFQTVANTVYIDMAISKLNPDGTSLIWATFIGGDKYEVPQSLFVNANNELAIYGSTTSINYPVTANAFDPTFNNPGNSYYSDIFVTKLNPTGTALIGSTYVGGAGEDGVSIILGNYGDNNRGELIQDASGNLLVASFSGSSNFPVSSGAFQTTIGGTQDGVVFKLSPDCSNMIWSTFFGGPLLETAYGIRLANNGDVVITGAAESTNLPTTLGALNPTFIGGTKDGYVARFNSTASALVACSYLGTTGSDQSFCLDIDMNGDIYCYGQNEGILPITPGAYGNPNAHQFIVSLNSSLDALNFSTTIGEGSIWGNYNYVPIAFRVDDCGYIYASGHSASGVLPLTNNAFYTTGGFYVFVLDPDATGLEFATRYGGDHVHGGTSHFDPNGILYQAVCSDGSFPVNANAFSTTYPNGYDIGVFKVDFQIVPIDAEATVSPSNTGCAPLTVNFTNNSIGASYQWDFGDGSPIDTSFAPTHIYTTVGVFDVMLIAIDSGACVMADTTFLQISVSSSNPIQADFTTTIDCANQSVTCINNSIGGLLVYEWDMGDLSTYTTVDVNHPYANPGTYNIMLVANDTICVQSDTFTVPLTLLPNIEAAFTIAPDSVGCAPFVVNFSNTSNGVNNAWDFGDGSPVATATNPTHTFAGGNYITTLISSDPNSCNLADTATITIAVNLENVNAQFSITQSGPCELLTIVTDNQSTGNSLVYDWNMGDGNSFVDFNLTHVYAGTGPYQVSLIVTDTFCLHSDTTVYNIGLVDGASLELGPDQLICSGYSVDFDAGVADSYAWSTGDTTQTVSISSPGVYGVTVQIGTCQASDSIEVNVAQIPSLYYTEEVCSNYGTVLSINHQALAYNWEDGSNNQTLYADSAGVYYFTVVDVSGCVFADSIEIVELESEGMLFVPNAFTPNGDGVNDVFKAEGVGVEMIELLVFDRWGNVVWKGSSTDASWDGSFQGSSTAPIGVYVYKLFYENPCINGKTETRLGHVTLVR